MLARGAVPTVSVLLLLHVAQPTLGDLPVHCLHHQIAGEWDFFLGPPSPHRSSCGHRSPDVEDLQPPVALGEVGERKRLTLSHPSLAQSATDDSGRWTMIYDEAFEVNVDSLSFLAFSRFDLGYSNSIKMNISRCGETQLGWYRNTAGTQWGCYYAKKLPMVPHEHASLLSFVPPRVARTAQYDEVLDQGYHSSFAANINLLQDLWTAKPHERWFGKSLRQLNGLAGIFRSFSASEQRERAGAGVSFLQRANTRNRRAGGVQGLLPDETPLPRTWDWRNVDGVNYLDPVIDQGECGSCYAVATTHMLSARHRIRQQDPTIEPFSISFPLYCSEYNQGCNGGYGILTAKWSQDVGLLPSTCMRYNTSGSCSLECDLGSLAGKRYRAAHHRYVGSWYGNAGIEAIKAELYRNGPLVLGLEPSEDFMFYSEGIYRSSLPLNLLQLGSHEWERVDHAVLLIGWGEEDGTKYWRIQNSWGPEWGEEGVFRILMGENELGIESMPEAADVVEDEQAGRQVAAFFRELAGGPQDGSAADGGGGGR